jgi:hypothetical protein
MKPLRLLRSLTLPTSRRDVSLRDLEGAQNQVTPPVQRSWHRKKSEGKKSVKKINYETADDDCSLASASTIKAGSRPIEERQTLKRMSSFRKRSLRAMAGDVTTPPRSRQEQKQQQHSTLLNDNLHCLTPMTERTNDLDHSPPMRERRTVWKSLRSVRSEKVLSRAALELAKEDLCCDPMRTRRDRNIHLSVTMERYLADSWNNDHRAEF